MRDKQRRVCLRPGVFHRVLSTISSLLLVVVSGPFRAQSQTLTGKLIISSNPPAAAFKTPLGAPNSRLAAAKPSPAAAKPSPAAPKPSPVSPAAAKPSPTGAKPSPSPLKPWPVAPPSPTLPPGCLDAGVAGAAMKVAVGSNHTCALLSPGIIKCWGAADQGQLGLDNNMRQHSPTRGVFLGVGRLGVDVCAGGRHSCAVLSEGEVKCWGNGLDGQLGYGDGGISRGSTNRMSLAPVVQLGTGRRATAISCGFVFTCALLDNGEVKCWGGNLGGQLGLGNTKTLGLFAADMGDGLKPVNLGRGRRAVAVSVGLNSACARLDDGVLKCWGFNGNGELGLGDVRNRGDEPGEMGDALPHVVASPSLRVMSVAHGDAHTCVLLEGGFVKCWGSNAHGQLGQGDRRNRTGQPGEMGGALPALQLGPGLRATAVTAGMGFSCALLDNGVVKCWGDNGGLLLGQVGDMNDLGDEPGEMGGALPFVLLGRGYRVLALSTSVGDNQHTCAIMEDRSVKCWGINLFGQLGVGDAFTGLGDFEGTGDAWPTAWLHACSNTADDTTACSEEYIPPL